MQILRLFGLSLGQKEQVDKKSTGNPYLDIITEANQCQDHSKFLTQLKSLKSTKIIQGSDYNKDLVLKLFNDILLDKPLPNSQMTISKEELTDDFHNIHNLLKAEKLIESFKMMNLNKMSQAWETSKDQYGLTFEEFINVISNEKLALLNQKLLDIKPLITARILNQLGKSESSNALLKNVSKQKELETLFGTDFLLVGLNEITTQSPSNKKAVNLSTQEKQRVARNLFNLSLKPNQLSSFWTDSRQRCGLGELEAIEALSETNTENRSFKLLEVCAQLPEDKKEQFLTKYNPFASRNQVNQIKITPESANGIIDVYSKLPLNVFDQIKPNLKKAIQVIISDFLSKNKVTSLQDLLDKTGLTGNLKEFKATPINDLLLEAMKEIPKTDDLNKNGLMTVIRELKTDVSLQLIRNGKNNNWTKNKELFDLDFKEALFCNRTINTDDISFNALDVSTQLDEKTRAAFLDECQVSLTDCDFEKAIKNMTSLDTLNTPRVFDICMSLDEHKKQLFMESLKNVIEQSTTSDNKRLIPVFNALLNMDNSALREALLPQLKEILKKIVSNEITTNPSQTLESFLKQLGDAKQIETIKRLLGKEFLSEAVSHLSNEDSSTGESVLYREIHFMKFFNDFIDETLPFSDNSDLVSNAFEGNSIGYTNSENTEIPMITHILNIYKTLPEDRKQLFLKKCMESITIVKPAYNILFKENILPNEFKSFIKCVLLEFINKYDSLDELLSKTGLVNYLDEIKKITGVPLSKIFEEINSETRIEKPQNFDKIFKNSQSIELIKKFVELKTEKEQIKFWESAPLTPQEAIDTLITTQFIGDEEKIKLLNKCLDINLTKKILVARAQPAHNLFKAFIKLPKDQIESFLKSCKGTYGITLEEALDLITSTNLIENDFAFNIFEKCVQVDSIKKIFLRKCGKGNNEDLLGFKKEFELAQKNFNEENINNEEQKIFYNIIQHTPLTTFKNTVSREQLASLYHLLLTKDDLMNSLNASKEKAVSIKKLSEISNVNEILFLSDDRINRILSSQGVDPDKLFGKTLDSSYFKMILLAQLFVSKEHTLKFVKELKTLKQLENISFKSPEIHNKQLITNQLEVVQNEIVSINNFISQLEDQSLKKEIKLANNLRNILELFHVGNVQVVTDSLTAPFESKEAGRSSRQKDRLADYLKEIHDFKKFDHKYLSFENFDSYQFLKTNIACKSSGWGNLKFNSQGELLSGDYNVTYKTHTGEIKSDVITFDLNSLEQLPSKEVIHKELAIIQSTYTPESKPSPLQKIVYNFDDKLATLSNKLRYEILGWTLD